MLFNGLLIIGGLAALILGADVLVNLLFILGLSAAFVPILFDRATLRLDLPAMIEVALLLYLLSIDGMLTRPDGLVLLLAGISYTVGRIYAGRHDAATALAASRYSRGGCGCRMARGRGTLMVAMTVVAVPVFTIGARMSRTEGWLFVATYAGYLAWLLFRI